ncbi:MAG TPA: sulfate ABC transporter ATP-binding protein [Acetobacteraceae bacterium]
MSTAISIKGISKRFGAHVALDSIDLQVRPGELLALLGPSGSGKTTLLRIIAGLDTPDAGQILFGDEDAPIHTMRERRVGFVFQHYALFRHMTVFENVAFGLRVRKRAQRLSQAEIAQRVQRLLELVQLEWLADRYPAQLSGGQRQRIALCRALAIDPRMLLLDEPFGVLDAKVRKELRRWLRQLHRNLNVTSVFVTHDQEEALELADRVVVLSSGRIEQIGTPAEVYAQPASAFVHEFLGETNRLECHIEHGFVLLGALPIGRAERGIGSAVVYVRPQDIVLSRDASGPGLVRHARRTGPLARVVVELAGSNVDVTIPIDSVAPLGAREGDRVSVQVRAGVIFPASPVESMKLLPLDLQGRMLSLVPSAIGA